MHRPPCVCERGGSILCRKIGKKVSVFRHFTQIIGQKLLNPNKINNLTSNITLIMRLRIIPLALE